MLRIFFVFVFLSFVLLLVPSCVFLLSPNSFAFGPFSFPVSFVVSLLHLFLLSPSSSSSFPFHFFLLALSSFPVFVFLFPRFMLLSSPSCCSFSFFRLLLLPSSPLPSSVTLILSSVFSCFSSLLFILFLPSFLPFLFSLLFSGPAIFFFVSSPLPSYSGSSVISFLRLFLLYRQFLPFLLLSFNCLFLSLAFSSSFTSFSLALLFLFLGFVSLSVFRCSFLHFPFACFCVLELYGLVFRFFLLLFSFSIFACFSVLTVSHSFLWASPFLSPLLLLFICSLYSSSVCIPPRFV